MRRFLIVCLFLAGCAGASQDALLASSCESFTTTVRALTPFQAQMNETQLGAIDQAVEIVPPICEAGASASQTGEEFDYAGAVESVRLYLRKLVVIQQEVE